MDTKTTENAVVEDFLENPVMLNILVIGNVITNAIVNSTVEKYQNQIDNFIDKLPKQIASDEELNLIIELEENDSIKHRLIHSEAPRYHDGKHKPYFYDTTYLSENEKAKASELANLMEVTLTEVETIRNKFKSLFLKIVTTIPEPVETHRQIFIFMHCLPDFIWELEAVKALEKVMELKKLSLTDEDKVIIKQIKDESLNELLEQHDSMNFLTDFI